MFFCTEYALRFSSIATNSVIKTWIKKANSFQIISLRVLLSICLIFSQCQSGAAYKSVAYKKVCVPSNRSQKQVSTRALKWHDDFHQEHESGITSFRWKTVRYCNIKIADFLKSSFLEVFCKKSILKNFNNFTGKH